MVEMMSMHGCGEHDDAPRPYMHTMGPRDAGSSVITGLDRGYRFGLIGSTDHHSAHPGSHGHGRLAVWAPELSRQAVWDAIHARRTYALTGDRIVLAFDLGGVPMGGTCGPAPERCMTVSVAAGGPLDYLEIVRNGDVVHRETAGKSLTGPHGPFSGLVSLSVGWGERGTTTLWEVDLEVVDGTLNSVEPRFSRRGGRRAKPDGTRRSSVLHVGAHERSNGPFSNAHEGQPDTHDGCDPGSQHSRDR